MCGPSAAKRATPVRTAPISSLSDWQQEIAYARDDVREVLGIVQGCCDQVVEVVWSRENEPHVPLLKPTMRVLCGCVDAQQSAPEFLERHGRSDDPTDHDLLGAEFDEDDLALAWRIGTDSSAPIPMTRPLRGDFSVTVYDGFDQHMASIGVEESNVAVREALRDTDWWTLRIDSPEVLLSKAVRPNL